MKVNLRIPTTLNDVTLKQYQEFAKLESKLDQTNDSAIQLKIVEIFLWTLTLLFESFSQS